MEGLHAFTWLCTALICTMQVSSMPPPCRLHRKLIERSYNYLDKMGDRFPLHCLEASVPVPFPETAFELNTSKQVVAVEKTIYLTLTYIASLFNEDGIPDHWKNIEIFENIIDRQIEESQCIMNKVLDSPDDFLQREKALKEYFEKILTILKEKNLQVCGWEIVRKEVLITLQFILNKEMESLHIFTQG